MLSTNNENGKGDGKESPDFVFHFWATDTIDHEMAMSMEIKKRKSTYNSLSKRS